MIRTAASVAALGAIAALLFPRQWKAALLLGAAAGGAVLLMEHENRRSGAGPAGPVGDLESSAPLTFPEIAPAKLAEPRVEKTDVPGTWLLRKPDGSTRMIRT